MEHIARSANPQKGNPSTCNAVHCSADVPSPALPPGAAPDQASAERGRRPVLASARRRRARILLAYRAIFSRRYARYVATRPRAASCHHEDPLSSPRGREVMPAHDSPGRRRRYDAVRMRPAPSRSERRLSPHTPAARTRMVHDGSLCLLPTSDPSCSVPSALKR